MINLLDIISSVYRFIDESPDIILPDYEIPNDIQDRHCKLPEILDTVDDHLEFPGDNHNYLHPDLISVIVPRLDLISVVRFSSVCKYYNSINMIGMIRDLTLSEHILRSSFPVDKINLILDNLTISMKDNLYSLDIITSRRLIQRLTILDYDHSDLSTANIRSLKIRNIEQVLDYSSIIDSQILCLFPDCLESLDIESWYGDCNLDLSRMTKLDRLYLPHLGVVSLKMPDNISNLSLPDLLDNEEIRHSINQMTRLDEIHLGCNNLDTLDISILTRLRTLHADIGTVDDKTLSKMTNLTHLDLTSSEYLNIDILSSLTSLTRLDISIRHIIEYGDNLASSNLPIAIDDVRLSREYLESIISSSVEHPIHIYSDIVKHVITSLPSIIERLIMGHSWYTNRVSI